MDKVPVTAEVLTKETYVKLVGRSADRQSRSQRLPVSFKSDTQNSTQVQKLNLYFHFFYVVIDLKHENIFKNMALFKFQAIRRVKSHR